MKRKHAYTVFKGVPYDYTGSLEEGINVFKASGDEKGRFYFQNNI